MSRGLVPALVLACAALSPAAGQNIDKRLAEARERYQECVLSASRSQFAQTRMKEMAVEQAFLACATEERVFVMLMHLNTPSVSDDMFNAAMVGFKLRLKQSIIGQFLQ